MSSVIDNFLKEVERKYTPLGELSLDVIYKIENIQRKNFKYGESCVAKLSDNREVILSQRYNINFSDQVLDVVNNKVEQLYFKYFGMKENDGKDYHEISFCKLA